MSRFFFLLACTLLLPLLGTRVSAQTNPGVAVEELEYAGSDLEAYGILYELVETMLASDHQRDQPATLNFARKLAITADRINDPTLSGPAYFLLGTANLYSGKINKAASAFNETTTQAMAAGDADLILRAVDELNRLQTRRGNFREAAASSQRAINYFVREGDNNSISRLQAELTAEKAKLIRQQEEVSTAKKELNLELAQLSAERDRLSAENEQRAQEIEAHRNELNKTKEQKAVVEQHAAAAKESIKDLSREALEQNALANQAREELARQELSRQEAEIHAERQSFRLYLALSAGLALSLLAYAMYIRNRVKTRAAEALEVANRDLKQARQQSDDLLANILPDEIAQELKTTGTAKTRSFPATTVMFCDFVNFTGIAEILSPEALVRELDICFKGFDRIIDQYPSVEKIKTVGDAYLVASGLEAEPGPPVDLLKAALAMQDFLEERAQVRKASDLPYFTGRIGAHTGPVVAGIVGARKFSYDIWGDTVNIASRLESESEAGRINVSGTTHSLIKDVFKTSYRGKVAAKHKGLIDMFFIDDCYQAAPLAKASSRTLDGKEAN